MKSKELPTKEFSSEGGWNKVSFYYLSAKNIPQFPHALITHLMYTLP